MKKGMKFLLYMLGINIGLAAIGGVLVCILKLCGLMLRAWVEITFFVIMVLLGLALAGGIIYTLTKVFSLPQEQNKKRVTQKVLSAGGIVVTLLGAGALGIFALLWLVFAYEPESVVEKHGQKMVAYEYHWHDTSVTYHEYKNFLVCGYEVIGRELYGTGFYTYEFYDTQGNLIAKSEEKQNTTQGEVDKEPEVSVFPPEKMQCKFSESDARAFCEMSYSTDGEKWKEVNTSYHYQFFFEDKGYLIFSYDWLNLLQREGAAIYKSIDGGKNWTFVSDTPSDELLQNTVFFDENTGIFEYGTAGTDSYILFVTTDGADTFSEVDLPVELQGQAERIGDYISQNSQ